MRRIIIVVVVLVISVHLKAQMIVNDPLNYAQIGMVIDEGVKQTQSLKKSFELMKQTKENLDKVSSFVKTLEDIDKIISLSQSMYDDTSFLIRRVKNIEGGISVEAANKIIAQSVTYNLRITNYVIKMTDLLTDNKFKLSDYERIELFRENLREMEQISILIQDQHKRVSRIESKIQLFKTF